MDKKNTSLEATMELMPPPIFNSEIIMKRDKDEAEIPFYKLSSGERQFLFLMSSVIYHVMNIKSVPTSRIAYRYVNIILDEVELCFHPEYQRTFLYKLLQSIQRLHLNTYCGFNIIITTHSPFCFLIYLRAMCFTWKMVMLWIRAICKILLLQM